MTPPPPAAPPFSWPLTDVFAQALGAVQGQLHRVGNEKEAREFLLAELRTRGVTRLLAWDPDQLPISGLDVALPDAGVTQISSRSSDLEQLDSVEVGLTAASAGLARTGSIVLHADHARGRLASLLPPVHYALLRADQLYPDLAAWLAAPGVASAIAAHSSTVIITGPSRTADIAQTLTLGAHGPKELHVVLIDG